MTNNINELSLYSTFKDSFKRYGKKTIKDRAVPDIRDGLKPVHRAILHEMFELNATSKNSHLKAARVVGNVIGKSHPHGDSSVYEAMVLMSTPWNNNVPIVDLKGNIGSVFGDPAAAYRYTEVRTTPLGDKYGDLLNDKIVSYKPNYDGTSSIPTVIPAQLPYLLFNGSMGIAVGVSNSFPPHNPKDSIETVISYIKNPKQSTQDLLSVLNGPDFPTGGEIINTNELLSMYETGKGTIRLRAKMTYDKKENTIHITELPYTSAGNASMLVEKISNAITPTKDKRGKVIKPIIEGVSKVENYSGRFGIDIAVELKRSVNPEEIMQLLYAKTGCESTLSFNFTALNAQQPAVYTLKRYLQEYVDFQHELIIKEHEVRHQQIERRLEIIVGLLRLTKIVDAVVTCAKLSDSKSHLATILKIGSVPNGCPQHLKQIVEGFRFTERQAEYIATLPIHRLSKSDTQALIAEGKTLSEETKKIEALLESKTKRNNLIVKRLQQSLTLVSHERKTELTNKEKSTAAKIETKEMPLYIDIDKYGYLQIAEKPFENSIETTNKSRITVFDEQAIAYNIHLQHTNTTKGRGVLIQTILPTQSIVGFTTLPQEKEGLFIFKNGKLRRTDMSKYMTKTKASKVTSGQSDVPLVKYIDIPQDAKCVVINGKRIELDKISKQGISGSGKKFLDEVTNIELSFE